MDVLMIVVALAGSAMVILAVLASSIRSCAAKAESSGKNDSLRLSLAKEVVLHVAAGNHYAALLHLEICNVGLFTAQEMATIAERIHRSAVAAQSADVGAIAAMIRGLHQKAARP